MKKKMVTILLALCLSVFFTACASNTASNEKNNKAENEAKKEEPTDLTGVWQSEANEGSYQEAIISETSIEINWVSDEGKTKSLYWVGTYVAPEEAVDEYIWTSENDKDKTNSALLASSDDTKEFYYKNGIISYEASALGTTKTMELSQISKDIPKVEEDPADTSASNSSTKSKIKTDKEVQNLSELITVANETLSEITSSDTLSSDAVKIETNKIGDMIDATVDYVSSFDRNISITCQKLEGEYPQPWTVLTIENADNGHIYWSFGDTSYAFDIYDYDTDTLLSTASKSFDEIKAETQEELDKLLE